MRSLCVADGAVFGTFSTAMDLGNHQVPNPNHTLALVRHHHSFNPTSPPPSPHARPFVQYNGSGDDFLFGLVPNKCCYRYTPRIPLFTC